MFSVPLPSRRPYEGTSDVLRGNWELFTERIAPTFDQSAFVIECWGVIYIYMFLVFVVGSIAQCCNGTFGLFLDEFLGRFAAASRTPGNMGTFTFSPRFAVSTPRRFNVVLLLRLKYARKQINSGERNFLRRWL